VVAPYVAVVGPGESADSAICDIAREVGRLLAERGAVVVTGGLGGVMAAAAEGARIAGGQAIGLLPGADRSVASAHHTLVVPTGLGELRNGLLVRACHGVISVGGSWGTLSEVALAMRTGVPFVCIEGWHVLDANGREQAVVRAASAADAVALLLLKLADLDRTEPGGIS
jgi:uncharacterized protein (TIGR00725 family)